MARNLKLLTDEQWKKIEPLLPDFQRSRKGGPKPRDARLCFEGILWILRTGARWKDLPERYPSPSTCWRRLKLWEEQGVWESLWRAFLAELDEKGQLDWSESFADGSFAPAKKGGHSLVRPNAARARSGWWWSTARVFLLETTWTRPVRRK
jgi:transposase